MGDRVLSACRQTQTVIILGLSLTAGPQAQWPRHGEPNCSERPRLGERNGCHDSGCSGPKAPATHNQRHSHACHHGKEGSKPAGDPNARQTRNGSVTRTKYNRTHRCRNRSHRTPTTQRRNPATRLKIERCLMPHSMRQHSIFRWVARTRVVVEYGEDVTANSKPLTLSQPEAEWQAHSRCCSRRASVNQ